MNYFALVDCNNFYASCERAFNPKLINKPIVVLSNNDGCIIARSQEAKDLGIAMGAPYWQIKRYLQHKKVIVHSSNYQLYGDISARIMSLLQAHCVELEIYSIDEAFLQLKPHYKNNETALYKECIKLKKDIFRSTGVPVSIGIAKTKTLAKLANHIAKKQTHTGVYILQEQTPAFKQLPISKVWGIAKGYQKRLAKINVKTVGDLRKVSENWMYKEFGVVGLRLLKELKGKVCYQIDDPISIRKNMMVSRSFRKDVFTLKELREAIAVYATRLGEKLRQYKQATQQLTIFLASNRFKPIAKHSNRIYHNLTIELPLATNDTGVLIKTASKVIRALYQEGVNYKKAGILASRLSPAEHIQGNLFVDNTQIQKSKILMDTLDSIHKKMGKGKVQYASCGEAAKSTWSRKEQWCSPRFTTRWKEILKIKI